MLELSKREALTVVIIFIGAAIATWAIVAVKI
jgi:hypothetical protein